MSKSKTPKSSKSTKIYNGDKFKFEYQDIKYKLDFVHPKLEQKREEILKSIQIKFQKTVLKNIKEEFIKGKSPKDAQTILDIMFLRFIMKQLSKESNDPVIPSKVYTQDSLINDLTNKLNRNKELKDSKKKDIINKILNELNLNKLFKNAQDEVFKFKLPKEPPNVVKTEKDKFIVLAFGDDVIDIYNKLYTKLISKFKPQDADVPNPDVLIWCLIKRYIYLRSFNQQLAVHPQTMKDMKKFGVGFELFGSALNTYFDKYCSLFYDIEKYFGSFGSIDNFKPIKGNYTMNPPFDEFIIRDSCNILIESLKESKESNQMDNLRFFIWIPIWDKKGIEFVNKECKNEFSVNPDTYGKYEGLEILEKSKFLKCKQEICLQSMSYYDYQWFKIKRVANTYLIVLSNVETDCKEVFNMKLNHEEYKEGEKKLKNEVAAVSK